MNAAPGTAGTVTMLTVALSATGLDSVAADAAPAMGPMATTDVRSARTMRLRHTGLTSPAASSMANARPHHEADGEHEREAVARVDGRTDVRPCRARGRSRPGGRAEAGLSGRGGEVERRGKAGRRGVASCERRQGPVLFDEPQDRGVVQHRVVDEPAFGVGAD